MAGTWEVQMYDVNKKYSLTARENFCLLLINLISLGIPTVQIRLAYGCVLTMVEIL